MSISRKELNAEIERLYKMHNGITPNLIVEVAKNPNSILHGYFEWDDRKAGHSFRLQQARHLITSVKVNIITDTKMISAVSYVRDPRLPSDQQGYVSIETLKTDKDLAKESIQLEFMRAYTHLQRAKNHAEILGMQDQVSSLLNRLIEIQETV
jgi:hypothetical protein